MTISLGSAMGGFLLVWTAVGLVVFALAVACLIAAVKEVRRSKREDEDEDEPWRASLRPDEDDV